MDISIVQFSFYVTTYYIPREKLSKSFERTCTDLVQYNGDLWMSQCKYLFFNIYHWHSYIQRIHSASEVSTELTNRKNLSPAIMMEMGIWVSWVTYWADVQQERLFSSSLVVF